MAAGRDIFLSYNSRDLADVRAAYEALHYGVLRPRRADSDVSWFDELEAALASVQALAVFVGPGPVGSV